MAYRPRGVVGVVSPVELPARDPLRHDGRRAGRRQRRGAQAGRAVARLRAGAGRGAARRRPAARRAGPACPATARPGPRWSADPRVHAIAFTGSAAVGLEIIRRAADTPEGQPHLKHVVAEMGGKNCVIVDADADLDEAVPAHRVLGLRLRGAEVLGRLAGAGPRGESPSRCSSACGGAIGRLVVGQASELATEVPPVIERGGARPGDVLRRVRRDQGAGSGRLPATAGSARPRWPGTCPPTPPCWSRRCSARCCAWWRWARWRRPATGWTRCPSRSPAGCSRATRPRWRRWSQRTPVGNLYVNRGTTGAMVGRQPFGGNRRSGVGAKAGGPDYLRQFCEPRVVSENTVRHGLAMGWSGRISRSGSVAGGRYHDGG